MQDNLEGQLTILKSQLQELAISLGDVMMPVIRKIVGAVQGVVDWLNSLDEGTKETIVTIGLVVAAASPAVKKLSSPACFSVASVRLTVVSGWLYWSSARRSIG